ncbi:MAG: DNA polymerase III subunit alpha [Pseudomonadota bacterium]
MLSKGDAIGVFQLESSGMRSTLRGLNADCLEDIIALVSLYRPGPMDNIPTYIDRKAGREAPDYLHPLLEEVLKETYGVIIYQEQVMQIAQILSGYSLGEADLLRRAMGKKKKEEMDKQKVRFVEGARNNNVDPEKAESIFELVAKFAGYGFNKSHAAAYAWISYQTAFLKANHTAAFLAASMSLDITLTDKLAVFVGEAKRCDVEVCPPCINRSQADFSIDGNHIHYALAAIKNVGEEAMAQISMACQKGGAFTDIYNFLERVDVRKIGKRGIEQLAKAGAFDAIHQNRAQIFTHADFLIRYSAAFHEEKSSNQGGLFGDGENIALERPKIPFINDWFGGERLDRECAALGFYLTGHPLDDYDQALAERGVLSQSEVLEEAKGTRLTAQMAGILREVTRRRSKSGKAFAWITLSDRTGEYEVTVFSELIETARDKLEVGARLFLSVTAEDREGNVRLTGEAIRLLDEIHTQNGQSTSLKIIVEQPQAFAAIKKRLNALPEEDVASENKPLTLVLAPQDVDYEVEMNVSVPAVSTMAMKSVLKTIEGVADIVVE